MTVRDPYAEPFQSASALAYSDDAPEAVAAAAPLPEPDAARDDAIAASAEALRGELEALSRHLLDNPELGFEEHGSVAAVAEVLRRHGIEAEIGQHGAETTMLARVGSGDGPTIGICSEYDALPGVGHGCGHNVICTIGLGAFLALADAWERLGLPGSVVFLGTPAEENGSGKEIMFRHGAFDGIDAAMMIHPTAGRSTLRSPYLGLREVMATFHGRSAHASGSPYLGTNALDAVVQVYNATAMMRQQLLPTDRIHGIITEGGERPNIIPDRATCHYYVRSMTVDGLKELYQRLLGCFEAAAVATGTRLEVTVDPCPVMLPVRTNGVIADLVGRHAAALGEEFDAGSDVASHSVGSTDMGNISLRMPAVHPNLAIAPGGVAMHSREFAEYAGQPRALDGIVHGATMLAQAAADLLANPALLDAARAEFEAAGGVYDVEGELG